MKPRITGLLLAGVMLLYAGMVYTGVDWGLPSRADDRYLFTQDAWTGAQLAIGPAARDDAAVGADVDVNPLPTTGAPQPLTATTADLIEIYRRYRLFTRQPDEMITIMALSGMHPGTLQFDPKLYQYGGLFIYPVGGLIRVCGLVGLFPVTGDLTHYLDRPGDMGKFYIAARVYAAAWGLFGILVVYGIGRRIGGAGAGVLAALLFALLPVVTCMSHEAKPHLPGAVLMLAACWFAMRALDLQRARDWAGVFVCCGAAVGMVLSAAPIVLLVPLVIGLHCRNQALRERRESPECSNRRVNYVPVFFRATLGGWLVVGAVYLLTNPYIAINLFANRAVLRSNFGNSFAMYEISRVWEGAVRVARLTDLGATLPVALLGIMGGLWALRERRRDVLPLAVPAVLFAIQFVLLGAGKPDEYGRFGVFQNCVLAISCAAVIAGSWRRSHIVGGVLSAVVGICCAIGSAAYLHGFCADAARTGTRDRAAAHLAEYSRDVAIALTAEPAPYGCPPLAFDGTAVVLYRQSPHDQPLDAVRRWNEALRNNPADTPPVLVTALDDPTSQLAQIAEPAWRSAQVFEPATRWLTRTGISWANKPIVVLSRMPNDDASSPSP